MRAPGDRLPSERTLSARWGAARMTVRSATDALIAEGLVERRHGSGTYVLPQPFVRFLGLTSFTQDMRDRGLVPSSRSASPSTSSQPMAPRPRACASSPATPVRPVHPPAPGQRRADGRRDDLASPAALVPGLAPADLDGSLYELLASPLPAGTGLRDA